MEETFVNKIVEITPKVDTPTFNFDYIFTKAIDLINWIFDIVRPIIEFFVNPNTWTILGSISIISSLIFLIIIIFSIVRLVEIQIDEKHELKHKIKEALEQEKEKTKTENPRWGLILKLVDGSSESDWRMAILEADSFMEESLKEKGLAGNTVSELLEDAKSNGYMYIQSAWDAHILRNKIAHEGSDFPVTQIEARKAIRLYQDFFEELNIV